MFEVHGHFVGGDGAQQGSEFTISHTAGTHFNPAVANVNGSDRFLVVWQESYTGGSNIWCRAVTAATGALSPVTQITSGGSNTDPDVGGERTLLHSAAVVVWNSVSTGILGYEVEVPATGAPVPTALFVPTAAGAATAPAISQSGGVAGRWLVTWQETFGFAHRIMGAAIERGGVVAAPATQLHVNTANEPTPAVDGNAARWLVAFVDAEPSGSGQDVFCVQVEHDGGVLTASPATKIEGEVNDSEVMPAVGWTGEAYLVAYADVDTSSLGTTTYDLHLKAIDPLDCTVCQPEEIVSDLPLNDERFPAFAAEHAGGATGGDGALLVYDSDATDVWELLRHTDAGLAVELGGGCGGGGTASVHCPVAGNPGVAHRNEGLTPGDLAWLVMSTTQGNATCGSCTLVPAIAGGFTFSAVAGPDGVAQVTTSVPANPALVGLVYWEQWIRFPGTANCLLGVDLSTALEVTVE